MKKIFLLLLACLELSAVSAHGFNKNIPEAWLNEISIRPITPSDSASNIMQFIAKPGSFVVGKDGMGELSISIIQQSKRVPPVVVKANFGKEASKLILYAVKHNYWLFLNASLFFTDVFSVSLIPYDLEIRNVLLGPAMEKPEEQWITDGVTFGANPNCELVTEDHNPSFLGLGDDNAILINDGGITSDWKKSCMHIDNVPDSLVPFLRFLVRFNAHVYITYDKATRKIYKIQLFKEWNDTIIII